MCVLVRVQDYSVSRHRHWSVFEVSTYCLYSGDFLYSLGGYDSQLNPVSTLLMFDPRLRVWIELTSMSHCRENFPVVSMANKLYITGGMAKSDVMRTTDISPDSSSHQDNSEAFTSTPSTALSSCEWSVNVY